MYFEKVDNTVKTYAISIVLTVIFIVIWIAAN